jgi:hypothetical protein
MPRRDARAMPDAAAPPRNRLHLAAIVILIAGWLAAASVFVTTGASAPAPISGQIQAASPEGGVREQQALERIGGTATVRVVAFNRWVASLWHGRRLAATLAVLASVVAALCWHIADLMAEAGDDDGR